MRSVLTFMNIRSAAITMTIAAHVARILLRLMLSDLSMLFICCDPAFQVVGYHSGHYPSSGGCGRELFMQVNVLFTRGTYPMQTSFYSPSRESSDFTETLPSSYAVRTLPS